MYAQGWKFDRTRLDTLASVPCTRYRLAGHQDWPFRDGDPPPDAIVDGWLELVETVRADHNDSIAIGHIRPGFNGQLRDRIATTGPHPLDVHALRSLRRAPSRMG